MIFDTDQRRRNRRPQIVRIEEHRRRRPAGSVVSAVGTGTDSITREVTSSRATHSPFVIPNARRCHPERSEGSPLLAWMRDLSHSFEMTSRPDCPQCRPPPAVVIPNGVRDLCSSPGEISHIRSRLNHGRTACTARPPPAVVIPKPATRGCHPERSEGSALHAWRDLSQSFEMKSSPGCEISHIRSR